MINKKRLKIKMQFSTTELFYLIKKYQILIIKSYKDVVT